MIRMKKIVSMIALLFTVTAFHLPTAFAEVNSDQNQGKATIEILPKEKKDNPNDRSDPSNPGSGNNGSSGNNTVVPVVPETGSNGSSGTTLGTMTSNISKAGMIPQTNELISFTYSFVGTLVVMLLLVLFILRRRKEGAEDEG